MRAAGSIRVLTWASISTLLGGAFFFSIVGVFGLPAAITALIMFIVISLLIFRRPQAEEDNHEP